MPPSDKLALSNVNHSSTTRRVAIETHGCKLNQADSQSLAREFTQAGYEVVASGEQADVYVINTCTVTHIADRKARGSIRSVRRQHPQALIVATGCYAERSPKELASLDGTDLVVGNREKTEIVRRVVELDGLAKPIEDHSESIVYMGMSLRTRAMVKIQEGCNQVCAYCIVPRVRGREWSVPPNTLIKQVRGHVADRYREVVLTGTQLGSYGFDIPNTNLSTLLRQILSDTAVERLRVSSLQPQEITNDLLGIWKDRRVCPHFHVPLQSGSDSVLRHMRRRYTASMYVDAINRIRRIVPNVAITTDIIVGFPSETTESFEETLSLCKQIGFAKLHVFPYSMRPGTSAAHFDGHVDSTTKRTRMRQLLVLAGVQSENFRHTQKGTVRSVLWENRLSDLNHTEWTGLTDNYIRVMANSSTNLENCITMARLGDVENGIVHATLV